MDFLTNSLAGLLLARCGLAKIAPRGALLLLLSINIPDIDYLSRLAGPFAQLKQHAGYTHALWAAPFLAALCVMAEAILFRQRSSLWRAEILCCLGVLAHLLLDWLTPYGLRPFLPFSSAWRSLDVCAPFDPILLTLLAAALVWPHFSQLVSAEIASQGRRARKVVGKGSAILGLIAVCLFELTRALLHQEMISRLETRLFSGAPPVQVAALPDTRNPLKWTGIVETAGTYRLLPMSILETFDPESGRTFFKADQTAALVSARRTEPFRYFQYFARFPLWISEPVLLRAGEGVRVDLCDLRFGEPGADVPASVALVDKAGQHILKSQFAFHAGEVVQE